ncbi:MAG: CDP-alcohol phosphatidyltransferase family protein, partial [Polymorphobacter sp.]
FKRVLPIRALIPNAVTVLALCSGLTGVRAAFQGEWEKAVIAVVIAGVLDALDGRIARLLKGTSRFGAELDSLSDLTAFGVAPALIIYFWALHALPGIGWIIALAHAVTCALRLARFNAQLDVENQPHKSAGFLTGIPAPVGAGLMLSPMFVAFWLEPVQLDDLHVRAVICATVLIVTAFFMISNLPTYSWSSARIRGQWRLVALLAVGLVGAALLSAPWMTLSLISVTYALSLPFAIRSYRRIRQRGVASSG